VTRQWHLTIGDDLIAYASQGKEHVDADETLVIAVGPDAAHLKIRELDLTAENAGELRAVLEPYLRAGHDPDQAPEMPPVPGVLPEHPGQGRRREIPGTRKVLQELRDFAAASGDPVPASAGKSGKVNYRPRPDQYTAFLAHLRQRSAAGDRKAAGLLAIACQMKLDVPDPGLAPAGNGQPGQAVTR
jgi:hypothetical protein